MPDLRILVGLINLHVGLIGIIICIPLLQGKVERNKWLGFRMKKSFESDENWYRINKYGAKWMIGCFLLVMIGGVLAFFIPSPDRQDLVLLASLGPILPILLAAVEICRFARKL